MEHVGSRACCSLCVYKWKEKNIVIFFLFISEADRAWFNIFGRLVPADTSEILFENYIISNLERIRTAVFEGTQRDFQIFLDLGTAKEEGFELFSIFHSVFVREITQFQALFLNDEENVTFASRTFESFSQFRAFILGGESDDFTLSENQKAIRNIGSAKDVEESSLTRLRVKIWFHFTFNAPRVELNLIWRRPLINIFSHWDERFESDEDQEDAFENDIDDTLNEVSDTLGRIANSSTVYIPELVSKIFQNRPIVERAAAIKDIIKALRTIILQDKERDKLSRLDTRRMIEDKVRAVATRDHKSISSVLISLWHLARGNATPIPRRYNDRMVELIAFFQRRGKEFLTATLNQL